MNAANDNWIRWSGGPCPVLRGTRVDIRDVDGCEWAGVEALKHIATHEAYWKHSGKDMANIIAYRVAS